MKLNSEIQETILICWNHRIYEWDGYQKLRTHICIKLLGMIPSPLEVLCHDHYHYVLGLIHRPINTEKRQNYNP